MGHSLAGISTTPHDTKITKHVIHKSSNKNVRRTQGTTGHTTNATPQANPDTKVEKYVETSGPVIALAETNVGTYTENKINLYP